MKIFTEKCTELDTFGGILKLEESTTYFKPCYRYHKDDGPAIEWIDGSKFWWYENKFIMKTIGDVTPEQVEKYRMILKSKSQFQWG